MIDSNENNPIDFLQPGHVWKHERNGREVTVLAVSNLHIEDERTLEQYPQQVVFLDSQGRVTTSDVERFLARRSFVNVDPKVEDWITSGPQEEDEETAEDDRLMSLADDAEPLPPLIEFISSHEAVVPRVTSVQLAAAFINYSQEPHAIANELRHKLLFNLDLLDNDEIDNAFGGDVRYSKFLLNGDTEIEWSTYLGVYPHLNEDGNWYGIVYFATPLVPEAEIEKKPEPKTPAKTAAKKAPAKTAAKPAAAKPVANTAVADALKKATEQANTPTETTGDQTETTGDQTETPAA